MAREIGKLTALGIQKAKKPGFYADGGGLYLRIGPSGGKSWIYRFMKTGKRHDMGLGPVHVVSLAEARAKATECRKQRLDGLDPLAAQKSLRLAAKLEAAKAMTFRECAAAYIEAHAPSWRNPKHADQWRNTLETYAGPVIGDLPVQAVDLPLVMKVLEPIWTGKTETASRLRGRIESVLDWATVVQEHIQIGKRAEKGPEAGGLAPLSGRDRGSGDTGSKGDLGQGIHGLLKIAQRELRKNEL